VTGVIEKVTGDFPVCVKVVSVLEVEESDMIPYI
jgi:hypothetical protein